MKKAVKRPRIFLIVLDSAGIGALPDAATYGDTGVNTLGHIAQAVGGLTLPTMQALGLGNLVPLAGVAPTSTPRAVCFKLAEASPGKDTTTGHWELMGLTLDRAFPTYHQGFPSEVLDLFTRLSGYGWLGNKTASGTEIINELGTEHLSTGKPIIYTSADSVFQIAAHTDVISLEELYRLCIIARKEVLTEEHAVARVIARPFVGDASTGFMRTPDRHDYSLIPPRDTVLTHLQKAGIPTLGIGKIDDIFAGCGIDHSLPTKSNVAGMDALLQAFRTVETGLIFANLVDFDMLYGHRRDVAGYGRALEVFDRWLADFLLRLRSDDVLLITADHGCDPTHSGSDHTREYVPLLVYSPTGNECRATHAPLPTTLGAVATIIARYFDLPSALSVTDSN